MKIVISNSSPLIALSRISSLGLLKSIFGKVIIPASVHQETVIDANVEIQRENITKAINHGFIEIMHPSRKLSFARNLGKGERDVINLAIEINPDVLLIDDKKARKEANELGFSSFFTTDILREAKERNLIDSYSNVIDRLGKLQIYLPG